MGVNKTHMNMRSGAPASKMETLATAVPILVPSNTVRPSVVPPQPRTNKTPGVPDSTNQYELHEYGYGKNSIKLLHVQRQGALHTVREYEVDTHLRLDSQSDYLTGVNKHIIATDTQKNTVYVLAKKYGVSIFSDNNGNENVKTVYSKFQHLILVMLTRDYDYCESRIKIAEEVSTNVVCST